MGKCLGGRKKGEGGMGLDQRPGNQSRGGFSPWLLRGKTEDRGDARETQAEGTRDGRVGKGGKRSKRLAATGVHLKPTDRWGSVAQPSSGATSGLGGRPLV